jgi:hypothetical protein
MSRKLAKKAYEAQPCKIKSKYQASKVVWINKSLQTLPRSYLCRQ